MEVEMTVKTLRVRVNHGVVKYLGKTFGKNDELTITERFFEACPGRFLSLGDPMPRRRGPGRPRKDPAPPDPTTEGD